MGNNAKQSLDSLSLQVSITDVQHLRLPNLTHALKISMYRNITVFPSPNICSTWCPSHNKMLIFVESNSAICDLLYRF